VTGMTILRVLGAACSCHVSAERGTAGGHTIRRAIC